ncbi:solute carrier family 2, facilitated glucose transporter member 3 [Tetranychus urticae]|uniref:Major facilitator superfamily (MFS) profile domain-containing protein n=1 Tax=Tetranychus urticae TaxID=32264 RepID=T1KC85_TETUR|nr:solute carrier family 2, facilitated glucose transporter member 3 [Tetranychus urticae]XP_015785307.1 solute carrier family 2, facilitated glucose transporter member 3 [Tetranychus urticae]XP_025016655.1 solute carrier family 2, facilitated glucose transporter member 3 [Tetranychus urticae]
MAPNLVEADTKPLDNLSEKSVDFYSTQYLGNCKVVIGTSTVEKDSHSINNGSTINGKTQSHDTGKVTLPLILGAIFALLTCSIPSGYNVGSVNTPQKVLLFFCNSTLTERGITLSNESLALLWSVCVSILLLGAIVGTFFTNYLANSLGRKGALLISGLIGITGSILFFASYYFRYVELLLLARFISGIHSGLTSGLVPLYIAEISPEKLKGSMGVLHVLGLNFGMIISQILGQENLLGTDFYWPILLSLPWVFIIIGMTIYKPSPSSPVYLYIVKRKFSKAANALAYLRRCHVSSMEEEIALLQKERKEQENNKSGWTFISLLRSPEYRKLFLLVLLLHIGQQFSGINAVFYYSTAIFSDLGMTMKQAQYGSICACGINAVCSLIVIPVLGKMRRRSLLFTSLWGGIIFLIGLTITTKMKDSLSWAPFATVSFFMAFVFIFAMGNGPIPWMIPSELLPQSTLSVAMGIGGFSNWAANFAVGLGFPIANSWLGDSVFLIFVAFGIFEAVILYFYLPETSSNVDKTCSTEAILSYPSLPSPSTSSTSTATSSISKDKSFSIEESLENDCKFTDNNLQTNSALQNSC